MMNNMKKVLEFLSKQERKENKAGEASASVEEIKEGTGLDTFEIFDALQLAENRHLVDTNTGIQSGYNYFISATIKAEGRLWLEENT